MNQNMSRALVRFADRILHRYDVPVHLLWRSSQNQPVVIWDESTADMRLRRCERPLCESVSSFVLRKCLPEICDDKLPF